jgi:AAA family ATP:ADP antiporter
MYKRILLLLNIKPGEFRVVKKLFLVQFFLGIAIAFLFTGSLTLFLYSQPQRVPEVFVAAAILLFFFNIFYGKLEAKLPSIKLLQLVILFSVLSIFCFWFALYFLKFKWISLALATWYVLIYMLVNYSFWGMASILFNVRESKRVISIIGAGDIPAKTLGYFSVSVLIPFLGIENLLWVSMGSFAIVFILLKRFQKQGFAKEEHFATSPVTFTDSHHHKSSKENKLLKLLQNRLVLFVALLCLLSYTVFAFIDYTFLSKIKVRYAESHELASFIAMFFAIGQLFAIVIKLLFSSRMIARIGLANSLLISPVLLLLIDSYINFSGNTIDLLYIFGCMALLEEILRSTLQEPVFFILFQPLNPHDRSRGHLFAEGTTMPIALGAVGLFLIIFLRENAEISILLVSEILVIFLVLWIAAVFLIRKAYMEMLTRTLKKGYFKGTELFLNDESITKLLLQKTESGKSLDVINALSLLERSNYSNTYPLLMKFLQSPVTEIKEYVLARIINNNMTSALPIIKEQLQINTDEKLQPKLIKALFYLDEVPVDLQQSGMLSQTKANKKAAMVGLLARKNSKTEVMVMEELIRMAGSADREEKMLALEIIMESQKPDVTNVLEILLDDSDPYIYKKAIEAVGRVKDFKLFPRVVEVASTNKVYPALQRSLLYYGDEIFIEGYWHSIPMIKQLLILVIRTAGQIKGKNATYFLLQLLKKNENYSDLIIDALWNQKAKLSEEDLILIEDITTRKIEHSKTKVFYYKHLTGIKNLKLLEEAIGLEIKQDLWILLKACALLFDRHKVDRVIELMSLEETSKISNAIEMLELILPNRYFVQMNALIELIQDIHKKQVFIFKNKDITTHRIIEDVLQEKANFNEWTKSVACYMLPRLMKNEFSLSILSNKCSAEDNLFIETRDYVLLMLK